MEFWIDSLDRLDLKGCFSLNVFFLVFGGWGGEGQGKKMENIWEVCPQILEKCPTS